MGIQHQLADAYMMIHRAMSWGGGGGELLSDIIVNEYLGQCMCQFQFSGLAYLNKFTIK